MKLIAIDKRLSLCPSCGLEMVLTKPYHHSPTVCGNCGYEEFPGSAYITTIFGQVLKRAAILKGIDTYSLYRYKIPSEVFFSPLGGLHTLINESNSFLNAFKLNDEFTNEYFAAVTDSHGLLTKRFVISLEYSFDRPAVLGQLTNWLLVANATIDKILTLNPSMKSNFTIEALEGASEDLNIKLQQEIQQQNASTEHLYELS